MGDVEETCFGSDVVVGCDLAAVGRVGEGHGEACKGDHGGAVLDVEVVEGSFGELKEKGGRGRSASIRALGCA